MASIAFMIGGAVLNATAFIGGNYLARALFCLRVGRDPVEKLCPVARVFGVSGLIIFESFVVALLFFKRGFVAPPDNCRR